MHINKAYFQAENFSMQILWDKWEFFNEALIYHRSVNELSFISFL